MPPGKVKRNPEVPKRECINAYLIARIRVAVGLWLSQVERRAPGLTKAADPVGNELALRRSDPLVAGSKPED